MHASVLDLQRTAGNRAVTELLRTQRQATTDDAGFCELPATAWIDDLDSHLQQQIDGFGQARLDKQQAGGRLKLLDQRRRRRVVFMQNLARHLGDDTAIEAHFRAITRIDLPGKYDLWVHETVRDRLLGVKATLEAQGTPMPSTTIGQSLRSRHLHPTSAGMMMHPLGYAVDWNAYAAPHVKDPRLHALFEAVTGGPPAFHLRVGGKRLGWTARHDLIERMGTGTADPRRAADLLASVESEYNRLKRASADFKVSLPADALADLRAVEDARNAVAAAATRLKRAKRRRRRDPDAFASAQAEHATAVEAFQAKKADVHARANEVFAPWLAAIRRRRTELQAQSGDVDLETDVSTPGEIAWLRTQAKADQRRARTHRKVAAGVWRQVRRAESTVVTTRSRIEAAQAWLASPRGRRPPDPDDAERWTTDLSELQDRTDGILVDVVERREELAKLLPGTRITPVAARKRRPSRPRDSTIATWRKRLNNAADRLAKADDRLATVRVPLAELVASRAEKLEQAAARTRGNEALLERLQEAEFAGLEGGAAAATRRQRTQARRRARAELARLQELRKKFVWLEKTAEALTTDVDFLFKSRSVLDPGVTQLLGLMAKTEGGGFFTPDPEAGESEQAKKEAQRGQWSGRHGYNLAFFKAMVEHGFELGVAWERSPDTMHFELVEGRRHAKSGGTRRVSSAGICE